MTKEELIKQGTERAMMAFRLREEGLPYKEICIQMGVSYTRVRQLVEKAERIKTRAHDTPSNS
jgi:DNA-directed RNA polymerase specialized sigma24 family protein